MAGIERPFHSILPTRKRIPAALLLPSIEWRLAVSLEARPAAQTEGVLSDGAKGASGHCLHLMWTEMIASRTAASAADRQPVECRLLEVETVDDLTSERGHASPRIRLAACALPVSALAHESQQERLSQEGIVNLPCHFKPNRKLALIRWGCPQRQLADKRRRLDLLFLRHSFCPYCSIGTSLGR